MKVSLEDSIFQKIYAIVRSSFAYLLAGCLVPTLWQLLATPFGSLAGFVAGLMIIGPFWYLIHFKKLIVQLSSQTVVIDMGLGIGTAVFVRDALENGFLNNLSSLLTLASLTIGASLAAILVAKIQMRKAD